MLLLRASLWGGLLSGTTVVGGGGAAIGGPVDESFVSLLTPESGRLCVCASLTIPFLTFNLYTAAFTEPGSILNALSCLTTWLAKTCSNSRFFFFSALRSAASLSLLRFSWARDAGIAGNGGERTDR